MYQSHCEASLKIFGTKICADGIFIVKKILDAGVSEELLENPFAHFSS